MLLQGRMGAGPGRVVSAESRSERGARVVGPDVSGEDGAGKARLVVGA